MRPKKENRSMSWGEQDRRTWIRGVWGKSQARQVKTEKQSGWLDGAMMQCKTRAIEPSYRFPVPLYFSKKRNAELSNFGVFTAL
jgi:hypothetical protein